MQLAHTEPQILIIVTFQHRSKIVSNSRPCADVAQRLDCFCHTKISQPLHISKKSSTFAAESCKDIGFDAIKSE